MKRYLLLAASILGVLISVLPAIGQNRETQEGNHHRVDLAVLYQSSYTNTTRAEQFWMQGGALEAHVAIWKGLGGVLRAEGQHSSDQNGSGVGLDLYNFQGGLRYTMKLSSVERELRLPAKSGEKILLHEQALGGRVFGRNSLFPVQGSVRDGASSKSLEVGGGISYQLPRNLQVRVLDAAWSRTELPDTTTGVQNLLVLGSGIALNF